MTYFKVDRWLPLKIIILLEAFWVFYFAVLVFWFQLSDLSLASTHELRLSLIILAFHAAAPIGLITSMEHKHEQGVPLAPFVWIIMAVVTDFWSLFDIWLHIAIVPGLNIGALNSLKALSIIAIILSLAGTIWYGVLLAWGAYSKKSTKDASKTYDYFEDENATEMKPLDRLKAKAQVNLRQSILK